MFVAGEDVFDPEAPAAIRFNIAISMCNVMETGADCKIRIDDY
jgi:hypothetical protein